MNLEEEVDKRVIELRKWLKEIMMVDMRKVRTIEKIVGECERDICFRICSQVFIVKGTITQEKVKNNKIRSAQE